MSLLKKILKLLPNSFQRRVRYRYYHNKLNKSTLNDEKDLQVLNKLVKAGDTVLDIGANYGLYTKFLSEIVGESGQVISFEPVPETYKTLFYNINRTGLKNVNPINRAASDENGHALISIPYYEDGTENFYEASLEKVNTKTGIKIETQRLDDLFLNKIKSIDFIKIDVEGHEYHVLKGAEKLIEKHHPKLMIEINDGFSTNSTGKKVKDFLANYNYRVKFFDGKEIRETNGNEEGVNFIFI